jgi:hypothetical protein
MGLKLMVRGQVVQAEAFCMTDADVARTMAAKPAPRPVDALGFIPQRNVVATYLREGVLRAEQVRAAEEIATHWHAVTRALHARCALYAERMPRGPDGHDPPGLAARTARYNGWAIWANLHKVTATSSLVCITLDVAVDGLSWRGVRAKRGIAQQRARRLVQSSLWRYAVLAGWAEDRSQAA